MKKSSGSFEDSIKGEKGPNGKREGTNGMVKLRQSHQTKEPVTGIR